MHYQSLTTTRLMGMLSHLHDTWSILAPKCSYREVAQWVRHVPVKIRGKRGWLLRDHGESCSENNGPVGGTEYVVKSCMFCTKDSRHEQPDDWRHEG